MKINLIKPYGFCSGVQNAIDLVMAARKENPDACLVLLYPLVHNENVTNYLKQQNISVADLKDKSVEEFLKEISEDSIVIFPAHGHNQKWQKILEERKIKYFDTICPLIKENIFKIKQSLAQNKKIVFVGDEKHLETQSILSINNQIQLFEDVNSIPENSTMCFQTTCDTNKAKLVIESCSKKQNIEIINTLCPVVENRLNQIESLESEGLAVVIGDKTSANANSLYKAAIEKFGSDKTLFINSLEDLKKEEVFLLSSDALNIVSATSTPTSLVDDIYNYLLNLNNDW